MYAQLHKLGSNYADRDSLRHSIKREPMAHHKAGLSFTASGYGARVPTEYMVWYNGHWRRVYCRIYSNIGTLFIGANPRDGMIVDTYDE